MNASAPTLDTAAVAKADDRLMAHRWKMWFWGRGNGWGMLGVLHTLGNLPESSPLAPKFRDLIARQAERLSELQDASGDWRTVLADPQSCLESSVAAFVVDGFTFAILAHGFPTIWPWLWRISRVKSAKSAASAASSM